ncbi:efflux RND transporter periplasmic adaptor subunit [Azospira inquinata]|uniref:efflux RND transporter periplasmic adaptor subunit n=1 Tax=Azospira inquinata TaxID=2785627 RepID=UPI001C0C6450|nr:efflux RND transporter periplasmic adaptor subunit [Azospira inquinata]QWT45747.1 efflux RND transporter periplasmic adaptor subunit [Azospira inquinata]
MTPPNAPVPATSRPWYRRPLLWVCAGFLALGGGIYAYRSSHAPSGAAMEGGPGGGGKHGKFGAGRPAPVIVDTARSGDMPVYINALGTVTPRNTVTVKSRIDGQLVRVGFTEGQMVKAGQLLAEIDPRPYEVQLAQAKGQLLHDQALLNNAQLDLARYKTLLSQDSIAKQQVDTQAALVRQYQGTVAVDQAGVDNAKLQLTYTRITAPIGGRVGLRSVDPGNMIHSSDTTGIVTITQLQPITAVFSIPEDSLDQVMARLTGHQGERGDKPAFAPQKGRLGPGAQPPARPATVAPAGAAPSPAPGYAWNREAPAGRHGKAPGGHSGHGDKAPGTTLPVEAYDRAQTELIATGTLLTVDNQIDTTTGTVKLRALFDNRDNKLFPNQFVNVRLLVNTLHDVVLIPTSAVQRGKQNATFVYVVGADKKVTMTPVTLGPTQGETTAVLTGLQAGAVVVADGADKLKDGGKVIPIDKATAARQAAAAERGGKGRRHGGPGQAHNAAPGPKPAP